MLERVPPGSLWLWIDKPGYLRAGAAAEDAPGSGRVGVFVADDQPTVRMVVELTPSPIVSGRVVDVRGDPAVGVLVVPYRSTFGVDGEAAYQFYSPQATNDLGEFRLSGLNPGTYMIRFEPPFMVQTRTATGGRISTFVSCVYPGVSDVTKATPIHLDAGVETRLNPIVMPAGSGGTLKVRVLNHTGTKGSAMIHIRRRGDSGYGMRSITFDASNEVDVGQLPAGPYEIYAVMATSRTYNSFDMGDSDHVLEVPLLPPAALIGRAVILSENGAVKGLPGFRVAFHSDDLTANANWVEKATGADGHFATTLSQLRYHVGLPVRPAGTYLDSLSVNGENVLNRFFTVTGAKVDLDVVFREGAGLLRGTVEDAAGRVVPGSTVVLLPVDARDNTHMAVVKADARGEFVAEVAPGEYRMLSWRKLQGEPYKNAGYLRNIDHPTVSVAISKQQEVYVRLKIIEEHKD